MYEGDGMKIEGNYDAQCRECRVGLFQATHADIAFRCIYHGVSTVDVAALLAEVERLRAACVAAAIPLEVLNMDNHAGAKWMTGELKVAVYQAVEKLREAVAPKAQNGL